MGSSDSCSRNNKRPRGVAETLQVSEHIVEDHRDEPSNVFANDPSGSRECNDAAHLRPEVAVVRFAFLFSGDTEGLAGEAPTDKIDSSKPTQSVCVNGVNVVEAGDAWPVLPKDGAAVFVALAECDCPHPSSLEAETEAANSAEEVEYIHARLIEFQPTWRGCSGFASKAMTCMRRPDVCCARMYVAGQSVFIGRSKRL